MPLRRNLRWSSCFVLILVCCSAACSSLHLPVGVPYIEDAEWRTHSALGIMLRIAPLEGRERYWSVFDENLPEFGLVAVWVEAENREAFPIDFSQSRWFLRVDGREYRAVGAAVVLESYHAGRRARFYSVETDRTARAGLEGLMFQPGKLSPAAKHRGFLFFRMPPEVTADWCRNAILTAHRIRGAQVENLALEVPLRYAHP